MGQLEHSVYDPAGLAKFERMQEEGYLDLVTEIERRSNNEKKQAMALVDNVGNSLVPNSLCTSPDGRGRYPNTKTCRGNSYTYPADGNADAAYVDPCPANGYASPTFPDASTNRYTTAHTNRHTAAYTDKHTRANGHAGVDIGISEMDERPGN